MSPINRTRRPKSVRRRGVTAVEFALTAPVLFLLIMTSVEFARMNTIRHTADNAAYEAARRGVVPGATAVDVETVARRVMGYVGASGFPVTVSPETIDTETETITVTVSVAANDNGYIAPRFFHNKTITSFTIRRSPAYPRWTESNSKTDGPASLRFHYFTFITSLSPLHFHHFTGRSSLFLVLPQPFSS